jgi:hypothetical protein
MSRNAVTPAGPPRLPALLSQRAENLLNLGRHHQFYARPSIRRPRAAHADGRRRGWPQWGISAVGACRGRGLPRQAPTRHALAARPPFRSVGNALHRRPRRCARPACPETPTGAASSLPVSAPRRRANCHVLRRGLLRQAPTRHVLAARPRPRRRCMQMRIDFRRGKDYSLYKRLHNGSIDEPSSRLCIAAVETKTRRAAGLTHGTFAAGTVSGRYHFRLRSKTLGERT